MGLRVCDGLDCRRRKRGLWIREGGWVARSGKGNDWVSVSAKGSDGLDCTVE
ncbi:hypothetical protein RchiOBHm_Chr2g0135661 [Rosa chinensis]|uniref:Uncharacterized protein n=1 Tax=Rosa chinensis TaxID=74649 RepID=A0A2P6RW37_ROSCH|nr:hypothetical protein RchiOBHm_Chr2g0135661 [Rosa chinensis]